jgi:hypothetical protein
MERYFNYLAVPPRRCLVERSVVSRRTSMDYWAGGTRKQSMQFFAETIFLQISANAMARLLRIMIEQAEKKGSR